MAKPYSGRVPLCAALCLSHTLLFAPLAAQGNRDPQEFLLAIGLIQRDMPAEAAGHLQSFLREYPRHRRSSEAYYRLGNCFVKMGQPEDAVGAFGNALEYEDLKFRGECRYRLGTTLQELDKDEPALGQFQALLSENEDDYYLATASRYAAGECLRDLGRDEDALHAFQATAAGAGDDEEFAFSGLYQAGFVQMRLGRNEAAEQTFAKITERFPGHSAIAEIHYLQGEAAFRAGNDQAAAESWQRCLQRPSDFGDDALNGLAWCKVRAGDKKEALNLFRRLLSEYPESELVPAAQLEQGRLLHETGEHESAAAELQALLERSDLEPAIRQSALELRGLALLESGASEEAMQSFESALGGSMAEADSLRVQYHLGDSLMERGEFDAAFAAYSKAAASSDPELRGDALYAQSLALHKLGRFKESQAVAKKLLEEFPEHRLVSLARFAIAENSFAMGDYAAASKQYDSLGDDHSMTKQAQFKGAWSIYLAGNPSEATPRFAAVFADEEQTAEIREEALSMQALTLLESGQEDPALAAADLYSTRYSDGRFLDRTERIAGRVLKSKGDLKGAAARLARAAKSAGDGGQAAELRLEEADVLFRQGNYEAARGLYSELAGREDRSGARALVGLAWCAFELGDPETCLQKSQAALGHDEIGDEAPSVMELMVTVHHQEERWDKAEAGATRYLQAFPKHARAPELRYALGLAQARGGDDESARSTLESLAEEGGCERPDRVHYELAWVCRRDGDEEAALASFAKVVELSEDEELRGEAGLHLGEAAIAAKEPEAARAHLSKVQGSYRGRALYRIGFTWLDAEQPEKAAESFEAIVEMGVDEGLFLEASFMAAESFMQSKEYASAKGHLNRLVAADPQHERAQRARLYLGECQVRGDSPAEAIAHLRDFLRIGKAAEEDSDLSRIERARAHLWIGKARQSRGEQDLAEQEFTEVTELSEGEMAAEAQYRIGETREARQDLNAAVDAYVKLSILYAHEPWVPNGLWRAGQCYERLEQEAKAQKFYKELIDRFPESDAGQKARNKVRGV
ncbi:MAG: tetratricopeptide repeat protein [Planctomycetota bacterium]|jgi:TolA-binding protein